MSTTSAKAVVDVIEALEDINVNKDKARKAAMSLADYIAELHRENAESLAKEFSNFTNIIDERFKVNEERIKTMFWKGALFLTGVILLANPAALSTISKILRLS